MYEIEHNSLIPENFIAGKFPIVLDAGNVKEGTMIHKFAPVIEGEDGIEEITAAALPTIKDTLVGIAADDSSNGKVVYYLTGEFFGNALTLPEGVTAKDLKPTFRRLGIFLKEMN